MRAAALFYILAALIRLAYFNVTEEERQSASDSRRSFYLGMPVTSASFLVPLLLLLPPHFGLDAAAFCAVGLAVLGVLFILPVRVPKPGLCGIVLMAALGAAELFLLLRAGMPL